MSVLPLNRNAVSVQDDPPSYVAQGQECMIFEMAWQSRLPVLLKGPTGCGKTRFVEHMAARLGRPLFTVSCHDDLSAADLLGRHLIGTEGTYWVDGPLTQAVRQGGICYLDEVVEARKDTTVILHALTDDRRILPIDRLGLVLAAPPEFMLVVSYNPGYQHLMKALKPSTRQRFVSMSFDFPAPELEQRIVTAESGVAAEQAKLLVMLGRALRQTAEHDLEEAPGTRLMVDAARLMARGCDAELACRVAIVECLTDEPEIAGALMQVVRAIFGR